MLQLEANAYTLAVIATLRIEKKIFWPPYKAKFVKHVKWKYSTFKILSS